MFASTDENTINYVNYKPEFFPTEPLGHFSNCFSLGENELCALQMYLKLYARNNAQIMQED